jgi:hypothetical protein
MMLPATLVFVPTNILGDNEKKWQQADERTFYPLKSFSPIVVGMSYFEWAQDLKEFWTPWGNSPIVGIGCSGLVGYYTGFPVVDGYGLTDRTVAHKKIIKRGRPGHEKTASAAYYESRDVDISDMQVYPAPYSALTQVRLNRTHLFFVHYDPKVIAPLRENPRATFVDFERHLRSQLKVPTPTADVAACDAWFAQEYYFSQVPDSPYRAKSLARLLDAGAPLQLAAVTAPIYNFENTHQPDPHPTLKFDAKRTERDTASDESLILGHTRNVVNTYTEDGLDSAVETLVTQPFALVGDVLEFWVGGGHHAENLRVSLFIDGTRQFSSGGCGTEIMGRRLWQIAAFKGRQAVLEIVDQDRGGWGHISVDKVVQWVPKRR